MSEGIITTRVGNYQPVTAAGLCNITAAKRHSLPKKDFALPGQRYPIDTKARARNALARGSQNASPAELAKIKAKVHAKFPDIGK